jgi:translation initiation factor RLI1
VENLSGGELQRFAIAVVAAQEAQVSVFQQMHCQHIWFQFTAARSSRVEVGMSGIECTRRTVML